MSEIGEKWALLQGGAFDYAPYHFASERIRLGGLARLGFVGIYICGIRLLITRFFLHFWNQPRASVIGATA